MNDDITMPEVPNDASTLATEAWQQAATAAASEATGCCHADDPDPTHQHGYITAKDNYQRRLRRIEGQARGLQRMVEEEKYCIDILTQVSAMTKALQSVALELLEDHMAHCVVAAAREGGQAAEDKIQEASEAIARLVRS